jgi:8-oxo-dGTP pyrophosphatase MutT (NUDIX family)
MSKMSESKTGARTAAAVLVLMKEKGLSGNEILLIERSSTVKTHQNQVAFPGGGNEAIDENDPVRTALRECFEEVGVPPTDVKVLHALPPLPTLTSGFFVVPVFALLTKNSVDLKLDPHEVAHAEWVPVDALLKTKTTENGFPVFEWAGTDQKKRKVWGLTAIIIDLIFNHDIL